MALTRPFGADESQIRGIDGGLTWNGYKAADVHRYVITRNPRTEDARRWSVRGFVSHVNPFTLAQRPLVFVAPHKQGAWYWPITSLTVLDEQIFAWLGPPIVPETVGTSFHLQQTAQSAFRLMTQQRR